MTIQYHNNSGKQLELNGWYLVRLHIYVPGAKKSTDERFLMVVLFKGILNGHPTFAICERIKGPKDKTDILFDKEFFEDEGARGQFVVIQKMTDVDEDEEDLTSIPKPINSKADAVGCPHTNITPQYNYGRCNTCGAVHTDSGKDWGIAKNKWFTNLEEALFYKDHGRYPE